MRVLHTTVILLVLCGAAAGCRPGIGTVSGRPDRFYGKELRFSGRIDDLLIRADNGEAQVFHLVSDHGHRVIVALAEGTSHRPGDQVRIRGTFVAEHAVGGRVFYDVLVATSISAEPKLPIPFL